MKLKLLRTPSLDLCVSVTAGIIAGRYFGFSTSGIVILAFLSVLLVLLSRLPRKWLLLPALFAVAGYALILRAENVFNAPNHVTLFAHASNVTVSGRVKAGFRYYPEGYRFNMEAEKIKGKNFESKTRGLLSVSVYRGENPPLPGDGVTLERVKIKPILSFRNFGGFDYERFMKDKKIGVRAGIFNERKMKIAVPRYSLYPQRLGEVLRRYIQKYIGQNFPADTAPIAASMSIGITGGLDPEVRRNFVVSGLAHLLAISGLHVGFVTAFAYFFFYGLSFFTLGRIQHELAYSGFFRKPAVILTLFVVLIFVLATGMRVSAVRAGIMVAIYLLSVIMNREKEVLNALAISAILILLFDPSALFSASFQMSYIAVLAIILLFVGGDENEQDPLKRLEPKRKFEKIGDFFTTSVKISIAAGLAVAPVVMAHFSEVHLGAFIANIIAVPLASVAVPATLIGALVSAFSETLGSLASWPGILAFGGIEFAARNFAHLHPLSFTGPPPHPTLIFFYYAVLLLWLLKIRFRFAVTAVLAVLLVLYYVPWPRKATEVHFFDVGQGDSALIMLQDGKNILVDGGTKFGRMDAGDFIIVPALNRLKVRRLDAVIATHGDRDHAGGLETVLKRINVEAYFDNGQPRNRSTLDLLHRTAGSLNIHVAVLKAGMAVPGTGPALRVIHPDEEFIAQYPNAKDNDLSIILMLDMDDVSLLLMGDLEKGAESYLIEKNEDLNADVLKVAHHGSRTSTTASFLNSVSPQIAVISAGRLNRYRYPSKKVLKRLEKRGIKVLNTKEEGEIVLKIKEGVISYRSFVNRLPLDIVKSDAKGFKNTFYR